VEVKYIDIKVTGY